MKLKKEFLYRTIKEAKDGELEELRRKALNSLWRQNYHIQPPYGLLNDPNGFCQLVDGSWKLFYQWFPYGPVHGMKHWYEVGSDDLVHWKNRGPALIPDSPYDDYGCYSGSGFIAEGEYRVFYTGNHRDEHWNRKSVQIIAREKNGVLKKELPAIADVPEESTEDFRDPFVWKEGRGYKAVIGARLRGDKGAVFFYESENGLQWQEKNCFTLGKEFGYMWECPNIAEIDGKIILIFCPQGLEDLRYENIYPAVYLIGTKEEFDKETAALLDYGFDYYAPQIAKDSKGKYILIAWMGLPEIEYPSDKDEWAHCMTVPRELSLKEGRLYQKPVEDLKLLRKNPQLYKTDKDIEIELSGEKAYEFIIRTSGDFECSLFYNTEKKKGFLIEYHEKKKLLRIDRSGLENAFGEKYGSTREINLEDSSLLRIFTDKSSIEIFTEEGTVLSSRVFPIPLEKDCCFKGEGEIEIYSLEKIEGIQ